MKKIVIAFFACLMSLAFAQNDLQVIAEVNITKREPITLGLLKLYVTNAEKQAGRSLTVQERREYLDILMANKALQQIAQKEGIKIADSQVNEYFEQQLSGFVGQPITEKQCEAQIKKQGFNSLDDLMKQQIGMTTSQYKEFIRGKLMNEQYILSKHGPAIQNAVATEEEIAKYYDVYKQNMVRPDSANVFLVAVQKAGATATEKATIDALRTRLVSNPKAVEQLKKEAAAEHANFFAADMILYKTEQAAAGLGITMEQLLELFALKIGTITEIKEMPDNFQFFVMQSKEPMKFLTLDDKIDPRQDVTVRIFISQNIQMYKQDQAFKQAVEEEISAVKNDKTFKISKSENDLQKLLAW